MRSASRLAAWLGPLPIVLALSKLHASTVATNPYDFTASSRFAWALVWSMVLGVAAYGMGLPDAVTTVRSAALRAAAAATAAALVLSLVQLVVGDGLLPRFVLFGSAVLCVPWWVLTSAVALGGRHRAAERDRVVLVADASEADAVRAELGRGPERPAVLAAVVSPDDVRAGRSLAEAVRAASATLLVLDRGATDDAAIVNQAASLHESGVRVRTLSLFYEQWFGKLPLWELERVSLLFDIREVHGSGYGRVKRLIDLAVGLVGLVVLTVLIPVVGLGDLVANRGPLFYRQIRIGKGGTPFEILKFRTMRSSDGASAWTEVDDARVTPFGRILRLTHLDELPQVVNILRGELSVVGPRPEQPHYVEALAEALPFYELRHLVRPGLTGWAQVKYHYGSDVRDAVEKLQYEFWYLRHQSTAVDTRILVRTLRSVIGGQGR